MTNKPEILLLTDYLKKISNNFFLNRITIMLYEGEVNHEIIKSILYTLESYFKQAHVHRKIQKKIFNVVVECIQNIEKHCLSFNFSLPKRGSLLLVENKNVFEIYSGNFVNQDQKQFLIKKETQIKNKTKEQLREIYKQQLVDGVISSKGGAGLGFIDIARKTNNKIEFYFFDNESGISYFIFKIVINKN